MERLVEKIVEKAVFVLPGKVVNIVAKPIDWYQTQVEIVQAQERVEFAQKLADQTAEARAAERADLKQLFEEVNKDIISY